MVGHIIGSFFFSLMIFAFAVWAERAIAPEPIISNNEDGLRFRPFAGIRVDRVVLYAIAALIVGAIQCCLKKGVLPDEVKKWLSILFAVAMLGICGAIMCWWYKDGGRLREILPFVAVTIPTWLVLKSSTLAVAALIGDKLWSPVVGKVLPAIVLILMIVWFLIGALIVSIRDRREEV